MLLLIIWAPSTVQDVSAFHSGSILTKLFAGCICSSLGLHPRCRMLLPSFRLHPHLPYSNFSPPSGLHPRCRMYMPVVWATSTPHASHTGCICLPFGLHPHWQPQSHRMLLLNHAMSSILTGVTCKHSVSQGVLSSLQRSPSSLNPRFSHTGCWPHPH